MSTHFEREIREQPQSLRRLLDEAEAEVSTAAQNIRAYAPKRVVIAARGSSDNAARYAQYLFGEGLGWTVALAAPSLVTVYGARLALEGSLVLGVSQSGQSPDIVAVLEEARRQGALTLAFTNAERSPLALAASHTIQLRAGEERAVAASKSYVAQLCALAMLCAELREDKKRKEELRRLPEHVTKALSTDLTAQAIAERWRPVQRIAVLGRGFNYASAFESALKLKETCYVFAEPYSTADFLHGPVAVVEPGTAVLLIAPKSKVFAEQDALLTLLNERRADVVAVTDDTTLGQRAASWLELPVGVPEWLSPVVSVVPAQLLALRSAKARGYDPDTPRGLNKVTKTR
jgi:glutamine---fructose-6-phosphate transaminase (isomerizing)